MQQRQSGFTLVELMLVVAIIGILSAIAVPSYNSYVLRTRLAEAHGVLASTQVKLEQFWSNNRTYVDFDKEGASQMPDNGQNFDYTLEDVSASAYTMLATGKNAAAGFVYSIDQAGNRVTVEAPDGWTTSDECWVDRAEGACTQ
ncbi:type IV pilin protein [Telluria beijingensis]|uniref:type IV pilin protein n=1 Tax=Telluria beijingensis TaxID=3068633 RepID=UPI0027952784|nr:type IV pilin protein [Massilia sp. REN29]